MSKKTIRQSSKVPAPKKNRHEQNSEKDDSAFEFIDRKKFKIEAATKEKTIAKAH